MRDQPVSVAVCLADVNGMARIGLELVAKPEDEVVHGARERRVRVAPYPVEQLVPGHHVAGPFSQAVQDLELPVGQLQAFRAAYASRRLKSITVSPSRSWSMGGLVLRRTACTRASSSSRAKGFVT